MAMNAVNSYFNRDWNRDDMLNLEDIVNDEIRTTLISFYLSLFCASLCCVSGFAVHPIDLLPTLISYTALVISLYLIPPRRVMMRLMVLLLSAYSFGGLIGYATNLFKFEKNWVYNFLGMKIAGSVCFLSGAIKTRERRVLYEGLFKYAKVLIYSTIGYTLSNLNLCPWIIIVVAVHALFLGYLVLYSQEILYEATFANVNFVNYTFTVFFNFPGVMIHASRLYVQGHQQN